jgi:hypothetical protein
VITGAFLATSALSGHWSFVQIYGPIVAPEWLPSRYPPVVSAVGTDHLSAPISKRLIGAEKGEAS